MLKKKPTNKWSSVRSTKKPSSAKKYPAKKKAVNKLIVPNFKLYLNRFVSLARIYIGYCIFIVISSLLWYYDSVYETLNILVVLGLGIAFIIWLYKNYKYLHKLWVKKLKHSASWAIRWVIIPFVRRIIPYFIIKDIAHYYFWVNNISIDEESTILKNLQVWRILRVLGSFIIIIFPEDSLGYMRLIFFLFYFAHLVWLYLLIRTVQKIYLLQTNN